MVTQRPFGYEQQLEEHQRRLQDDPQYLENLLEQTKIERVDEPEIIEERIRKIYAIHGAEDELSGCNDLIKMINKAYEDAQRAKWDDVTKYGNALIGRRKDEPLTDRAYYYLEDLPINCLESVDPLAGGITPISYEEARQVVEEGGRFNYSEVAGWGVYAATQAENIGQTLAMLFVGIPSMLLGETIDSLSPTSTRIKRFMELYNKDASINFQQFKRKMDEIFELYLERL